MSQRTSCHHIWVVPKSIDKERLKIRDEKVVMCVRCIALRELSEAQYTHRHTIFPEYRGDIDKWWETIKNRRGLKDT